MVVCNWHRSKVRPSWSQGNKSVAFRLCSIERYNDKTPPHELELIFFLTFISAWLNLIHLKCMFDAYTFIIVGNTRTRAGKGTEPKNVEAETGGGQKQVTIWAEQFVNRLIQYSLPWPHMLDVIYTRMRTCVCERERAERMNSLCVRGKCLWGCEGHLGTLCVSLRLSVPGKRSPTVAVAKGAELWVMIQAWLPSLPPSPY